MSPGIEDKAAWSANSDRNFFEFTKVPFVGLGALAAVATLSGVSMFLPAVLFSTAVMTVMPVAAVGVVILALAVAGIYTYVNRNKQIDDRTKLDFDNSNVEEHAWELYMDEDMDLLKEMNASNQSKVELSDSENEDNIHFDSPVNRNPSINIGAEFDEPDSRQIASSTLS